MITIHSRPQELTPAYNDITYVVSDTESSSANFRFIGEVKSGGGTTLAKLKNPLLNGETKGVFMIQRILENYVTYDFDLANTLTYFADQNSMFEYEVEFGHEYGTPAVETTNETNDTGWTWNAGMTKREFSTYSSGEWISGNGSTGVKFLTNRRSKRIRLDQWDWLYLLEAPQGLSFFPEYAKYISYDAGGNVLKTVTVTYATGSTTGNYFIGKVPSGRNTTEIGSVLSGTLPVVHTSAAYYTIALFDNNDNQLTEAYRIDLVNDCNRYTQITLYYLNPMGGFDSFMFDMASRPMFDMIRKQMRRQRYELVGNNYTENLNKHGLVYFDTKYNKKMKLNSDWITDAESAALNELISSPVVFLHIAGEDVYTPVIILTDTWEEKTTNQDMIFNCTLEVQFDMERRQGA